MQPYQNSSCRDSYKNITNIITYRLLPVLILYVFWVKIQITFFKGDLVTKVIERFFWIRRRYGS